MDTLLPFIAKGVFAPIAVAALVLLVGERLSGGASGSSRQRGRVEARAAVLALGLAYVTGHMLLRWPFPVVESTDRIPVLVTVALVLGLFEGDRGSHRGPGSGSDRPGSGFGSFLRVVLAGGTSWWFLSSLVKHRETGAAVGMLAVITAIMLVGWIAASRQAQRTPGPRFAATLMGVTSLGAGAVTLSTSAFHGQLAGVIAAALGTAAVIGWVRGTRTFSSGTVAPYIIATSCLWMGGALLSALPVASAVLLGLAPCGSWLEGGLDRRRDEPRRSAWWGVLAPLLMALAACVVAWVQRPPPNPYY